MMFQIRGAGHDEGVKSLRFVQIGRKTFSPFQKKLPLDQAEITLCAIWTLRISESSKLLLKACGLDRIQISRRMSLYVLFSILASSLFVLRSEDVLSKRILLGKSR